MKIYVVIASEGEYSDRTERLVRWFADEKKAEAFEFACEKQVRDYENAVAAVITPWRKEYAARFPGNARVYFRMTDEQHAQFKTAQEALRKSHLTLDAAMGQYDTPGYYTVAVEGGE